MKSVKHVGTTVGALFFGYALAIFCYGYVAMEHPAYLWDWGGYFRLYQHFGALMSNDAGAWFRELGDSIRLEDYNASTVAILFPFYEIFGPGRTGYILAIVVCFLVPATLISATLSIYSARRSGVTTSDTVAVCVVVATVLFPPFWQATLRGMPDIAGLIPLGSATWLILKSDFLSRKIVRNAIAVGVLIWMTFLFRRWYAFACISLMACTFAVNFARFLYEKDNRAFRLREISIAFSISGTVAVLLLLIFQSNLVFRILTTSYGDLYTGYQAPLADQLWMLYQRIGPLYLLAFVVGLIVSVVKKSTPILFMSAVGFVTYFLFSRTQAPAVQHGLPLYFWGLPAVMFGAQWVLMVLPSAPRVYAVLVGTALSVAVFLTATLPTPNAALPAIAALAPQQTYFPLHVENYPEYQRLISQIKDLTADDGQFAVFASSELLSDSLLDALDQSLAPKIAWSSQVDERDGLRLQPIRAKYAVVADPVPLHLPMTSQRVITVPAEHILRSTGFGSSYRQIAGPFNLAGGRKAFIFERTNALRNDEIMDLAKEIASYHPGWSWDGADLVFTRQ